MTDIPPIPTKKKRPAYRGVETKPRNENDFYATPPGPIQALLKADDKLLWDLTNDTPPDEYVIWEPSCGDGALVRPMRKAGFKVYASDLIYRGCEDSTPNDDFFSHVHAVAPAIITNPPYNLANGQGRCRYVYHALQLPGLRYLALLMNSEWERSQKARQLLAQYPYAYVGHLDHRIDWTNGGNPADWHSWFVWIPGSTDTMRVRHLKTPQLGRPSDGQNQND